MSPNGTSQQLSSGQITAARSSSFARVYTPLIAGDYNQNGVVDAADYVVWCNTLGQSGSGLAADGNNNGSVDTGDFTVWRSHFGSTTGTGSGVPITSDRAGLSTPGISVVPEANGLVYLLTTLIVVIAKRPSEFR